MPKQYNIRWTDTDKREINNAVRNFNAKRSRLLRQVPELEEYLPKRISVRDVKERINSRRDLEFELRSLRAFQRRGSNKLVRTDSGLIRTRYELTDTKRRVNKLNKQRAETVESLNLGTTTGTMGNIRKNNLLPKQYNPDKIKPGDFAKFVANVNSQLRNKTGEDYNQQYVDNFLQAVQDRLPFYEKAIKKRISKIDNQVFVAAALSNPSLSIDYVYDPHDAETVADNIIEILEGLL